MTNIAYKTAPIEGWQKGIQYSMWHNDTIGKGLWSGEDNEVPKRNRDVRGNADFVDNCLIITDDYDTV